ncbi:MAG: leucyl/phenylalanyl-tRNA--protein transferase [Moraxellaceae bacterium]|nr:leucyl/phenylalanyl-tRNA--protein transferase [Moraxellaceae bacterium]
MIPWLGKDPVFPPVRSALREPNGLLAAGGQLGPEWLLAAYHHGIFPWFSEGEPILWWSPDPRMVVVPGELRVTRSLRKTLRSGRFQVRCDTRFADVMAACAAPRSYAQGTWITPAMQAAYCRMHELGWAHSVEAWDGDELVGGLYGMALGRVFYGESMFHRATDASKVAFAHLARWLEEQGFVVIDCQMTTAHLASLGGRELARADFVAGLPQWTQEGRPPGRWPADAMAHLSHTDFAADWS